VEVVALEIKPKSKVEGRTLAKLNLPRNTVVAGLSRGNEAVIPHGGTAIHGGDHVLIFTLPEARAEVERLFE
jgi:Trk K+ transport system NAD-binding subunit